MKTESAYQKALDYIYSFVDYSLKRNFRYSPENFNLARMEKLAKSLGNPHQQYPVIHVAGTKGKGSVAAMCSSALHAAGYRVGFYTSPHLQDFTERIQVDGDQISQDAVVSLTDEMKPHIEGIPELTTFEITTALAMLYFARREVNAAVLEVGLGGRLDATNIVMPYVSVITSISYDHTQVLGNTLREIAGEKAGIIKPGVPVVSAPQAEEAQLVIARIAVERGAKLIQVGRDFLFTPLTHSLDGQTFAVWETKPQTGDQGSLPPGEGQAQKSTNLQIPLLGYHQIVNAATAFAALQTAQAAGLKIGEDDIRQGFADVKWPGRFEVLRREPPVILDSAHNRDSALKLRLAIDEYFPDHPVVLVFGASEDKDIQGMYAELLPRVELVIVTQSIHPRAMDCTQLSELAAPFGKPVRSIPGIEDAFQLALQFGKNGSLVLVTGSLFIVAGAKQVWQEMRGQSSGMGL